MPIFDPEAVAPIISTELIGALTLLPGTTITDNEYGLDTMVRPFFGMADEIMTLAPKRGEADLWFPNFSMTDISYVFGRGCTATALVTYKGLVGNDLPPPTVRGGWSETSAQLSTTRARGLFADRGMMELGLGNLGLTDGGSNTSIIPQNGTGGAGDAATLKSLGEEQTGEVTVTYHSPTTTYLYITRKEPKKQKYYGSILASDGDFQIIEIQPASFKGRPICNREIRTIRFDKEKVGRYWQVMEVNQGILTSLPVALRSMRALSFPTGYRPRALDMR